MNLKNAHMFLMDQRWLFVVAPVLGITMWAIGTIIRFWPAKAQGKAHGKSSFQKKMAGAFALFVAIPCFILASVSIFFIHVGLHTWFDRRVKEAVQGADFIAKNYLKEQYKLMGFFNTSLMQSLNDVFSQASLLPKASISLRVSGIATALPLMSGKLTQILNQHESMQGITAMIFWAPRVFSNHTTYAHIIPHACSMSGQWLAKFPLKKEHLKHAKKTGMHIQLEQNEKSLLAIMPLDKKNNTFVLICHPINRKILQRVSDTNKAVEHYTSYLKTQEYWVSISIVIFIVFTLILILLAMAGGLSFAQQTIQPISALIQASEKVRQGQTPLIPCQTIPATSELRYLMNIFNTMSSEVGAQTKALNKANAHLHNRNLFIESVLEGISSGVFSLTPDTTITFFNSHAQNFFPKAHPLNESSLLAIAPEFDGLLKKALSNSKIVHNDQIALIRNNHVRTFQVHIQFLATSDTVVVTMDDISALISAQKKSAWSDVACRIAHEVKNPLTPIALSAERLRRRYIKEIKNEPEIFHDCIDTIIRQVHHIGDLISEFSDFARLPQPILKDTDLNSLVTQLVVLHQQAYPLIQFTYSPAPIIAHCDTQQIEQVLTNIFKNAIESIHETLKKDGEIVVSYTENDHWLMISIQDNGAGLSMDKALVLCEPYQTTKAEGMGLGLAIVQKIIDDHGGLFSIQPNGPNQPGAIITISLPRKK